MKYFYTVKSGARRPAKSWEGACGIARGISRAGWSTVIETEDGGNIVRTQNFHLGEETSKVRPEVDEAPAKKPAAKKPAAKKAKAPAKKPAAKKAPTKRKPAAKKAKAPAEDKAVNGFGFRGSSKGSAFVDMLQGQPMMTIEAAAVRLYGNDALSDVQKVNMLFASVTRKIEADKLPFKITRGRFHNHTILRLVELADG